MTHIFDPDEPCIASDAMFDVEEDLLATFGHVEDAAPIADKGVDGPFYRIAQDLLSPVGRSGRGQAARTVGDPGTPE